MGMARRRRTAARRPRQRPHRSPGELVREVVASELERIGDARLVLVTITDATVDGSLEHGRLLSALQAEDGRLDEGRGSGAALEGAAGVNCEVRARHSDQPRHDDVLRSVLRADQILRDIEPGDWRLEPDGGSDGEPRDPDDGS